MHVPVVAARESSHPCTLCWHSTPTHPSPFPIPTFQHARFSHCSWRPCAAPGCSALVRDGKNSCIHNSEFHGPDSGFPAQVVHEYVESEEQARELLDGLLPWSPVSRGSATMCSFRCPCMATSAGLESNLRRNAEAQQQLARSADAGQCPLQNTAGRAAERRDDRGLGKGQMPSAKVDTSCCTEAFFEVVGEGERAGQYLVRAYINHGPRCMDEERRCPQLTVIARQQLDMNPGISAPELHNFILLHHKDIEATKAMCNTALWRLRRKAAEEGKDYASSQAAPTSVRLSLPAPLLLICALVPVLLHCTLTLALFLPPPPTPPTPLPP